MEVNVLVTDVKAIIQDTDSYGDTWVLARFNEALTLLATMCRIPGLQVAATVSAVAGTSSIAMPRNFLHDLFLVTTVNYPEGIPIAPNIWELIEVTDSEETGPVAIVSVDNRTLNFRPIPEETETLTLYYYKKPNELAAGDSFPDYIPDILHREIFQNYALKEAYLQIEDGIDGAAPNTQKYGQLAFDGIAALNAFYANAPKARPVRKRTLVWY